MGVFTKISGWLPNWWARVYTRGLPDDVAKSRQMEIRSDTWEHLNDPGSDVPRSFMPHLAFLYRWLFGIPQDLMWRIEEGRLVPGNQRGLNGSFIGNSLIFLLLFIALISPLMAPFEPLSPDGSARLAAPSARHLLGTNHEGMDILSRLLFALNWSVIGSLLFALPSIVLSVGLIRLRTKLFPDWANLRWLARWFSWTPTTRFWLTSVVGLLLLLPGMALAFTVRSLGYFGITVGPNFPEVGLLAITSGLLPWIAITLVLTDTRPGLRSSFLLLTWCWAFVLTVLLGSSGFWFTDWPNRDLGAMIEESVYLVPVMVGLDFAHWMFWPPVIAGLVGSAVLVAGARLTNDRDVSLPVFLMLSGVVFRSTEVIDVNRGGQLLNNLGAILLVGAALVLIISTNRRRRLRNL